MYHRCSDVLPRGPLEAQIFEPIGVRPEDIQIAGPEDPKALPGRIDLVEKVGAEEYLSVVLGDGASCIVRASIRVAAHEGERIGLRFPPDSIHLFTTEGLRLKSA